MLRRGESWTSALGGQTKQISLCLCCVSFSHDARVRKHKRKHKEKEKKWPLCLITLVLIIESPQISRWNNRSSVLAAAAWAYAWACVASENLTGFTSLCYWLIYQPCTKIKTDPQKNNVVPNSNLLRIKRFVPGIAISFEREWNIIMQKS